MFTCRRLHLLTLLSVLTALCCRGEFHYYGGHHGFAPLSERATLTVGAGSHALVPLERPADELELSVLLTSPLRHAITLELADAQSDTLSLTLSRRPGADDIYGSPGLDLTLRTSRAGIIGTYPLKATPHDYLVDKDRAALTLQLFAGNAVSPRLRLIGGRSRGSLLWEGEVPADFGSITAVGSASPDGSGITVSRASLWVPDLEETDVPASAASSAYAPYAGTWILLDYAVDDTQLRPGGDYTLTLRPEREGGYALIYESGAIICPERWQPGMRKGTLTPTRLPGLYRLSWLDAEGRETDRGATLQFSGTDLCVITFPTGGSTLRLHRLRQ